MTIIEKKTSELKEYANNPRNNAAAVQAVAESIKQFGFKVPIVIDKDGVIIAGHTRKKAAETLGLEVVPCIVADDLTPEQVQAFRLADNKTGELAEWDFNKLEAELFNLQDTDMSVFGFEDEVITADEFGEDFTLPDSDIPQKRTITLTLSPQQYEIAQTVIEYLKNQIEHDFGNEHETSNAFFEAVYRWAKVNSML